ncbi:lung adenoma susceptibility protein 2 [Megalops cyprinoides]|uniref:lung adenoma susceptibility protein 2 n=1 Tax=Megalops cyprinoides TaxID=118141 RepID=UPI00186451CC|nr:lung adenoma susceptibility protein 2 [Megalops cyprinoides]
MASADGLPSPESTVTSLLASSGYLKSSMLSDSSRSIRYKGREYESATEALDAYIADFQRSLRIPDASTGALQLPKDPVTPVLPRTGFRNKDVLKESLTDGELDFLNLPVGAGQGDPDSLSLTTDDLLVLPADGSMPVTRTSAYLTQRTTCPLGRSPRSRPLGTQDLSALRGRRRRAKGSEAEDVPGPRLNRSARGGARTFPLHSTQRGAPEPSSARPYPRWLTSRKSDMDFSGITSVPELAYPTWVGECDATSDPPDGSAARGKRGRGRALPPSPEVPTWLGQLEASYEEPGRSAEGHRRVARDAGEGTGKRTAAFREEADCSTLRDLRLEFAQQLAAAEEREGNANYHRPFRDDRIESLILKAEKALASPSLGRVGRGEEESSSPRTEDVLDADRSWDNPVAFKPPVPVGDAEDQLNMDNPAGLHQAEAAAALTHIQQAAGSPSSGYSSRKHPGPVEALKQMLFSLQAVEQRVTQDQEKQQQRQDAPTETTTDPGPSEQHQPALRTCEPLFEDYESGPGGQSLQRALHHLGRLKCLVDDMNDKKAQECQEENGV